MDLSAFDLVALLENFLPSDIWPNLKLPTR